MLCYKQLTITVELTEVAQCILLEVLGSC